MERDLLEQKIQQCQMGSADAFAWMLEEYGTRLYGYFFRTTGSSGAADDLVQELFVRLLEKIGEYRHEGRFEHWLFRIAANLTRDYFRRQKKTPVFFSVLEKNNKDSSWPEGLAGNEQETESPLERQEQMDQLQDALKQLSDLDREIILARHYGQLSFDQLAQQFQMPIGTVLSKVHRGLKILRRILTENEKE